LWRAVDQDGFVLDVLVQSRRDKRAAKRLLRKLLKKQGRPPHLLITDKLASYRAAKGEVMPGVEHRRHKGLNDRAENSPQPTRCRERQIKRFKPPGQVQRFQQDKQAAKRFFRQALGREHTRNPREIIADRLKSYPGAVREMKRDRELWRFTRHRRGRWLNNRVEQDHRRIKRRTGPMLGFGSFWTARRTLAGVEAMAMLAKGQVRAVPGNDLPAQRAFVHQAFGIAA
jgi:transposase-like protein